jgi:hypothetical protein
VSYTDLNHNQINEDVIVREIEPDMVYELLVVEEERIIWSAEAGLPHVGWTTYLHYEQDCKCYLVEYQPQMYQGVGTYKYRMFSLNNNVETIKKRGSVDYELPLEGSLEITSDMEQFAEEMEVLLRNSNVLLSTEQGILVKQSVNAVDLSQIYPVYFDPDEKSAAINGTGQEEEITSNAASFPNEPLEMLLASGAGAWGSRLVFCPDGSFSGEYHDSEASVGEDYPDGTCYVSVFEGRFTDIEQISDYFWTMRLVELSTAEEKDTTWIKDKVRYIAADALGIAGGEEFILFAPGTKPEDMPAECRDWWPDAYEWRNGEVDQLEGWALYNVSMEYGFFTGWLD